jgi:hypothetical protein
MFYLISFQDLGAALTDQCRHSSTRSDPRSQRATALQAM